MEQLQSFRTELVEWFKEIVPFSKLDLYIRKTREGYNHEPIDLNLNHNDNHVSYLFCTDNHRYSISATPWYLGCTASTSFYRPGEDWTRGNDLPDGPFSYQTWLHIKDAIIRYEMVKLVETKVGVVPTPDITECIKSYACTKVGPGYHSPNCPQFNPTRNVEMDNYAKDGTA